MADGPNEDGTDPLADTHAPESSTSSTTKKKRAVHTGDTLGRYELGDEAGEGGMATVYRARDKELRRDVAIKVLFHHLARRPEIHRRFHREARAAAALDHPNILRIYDVGGDEESDDPPFIVMELVRGPTLLGEIELRGPMFPEVVACIGALLADALACAHAAGIIHRDIKPANVLVAAGGKILLADFGVARLETEDSLVTKTGALLGTPAYMSPEQASGDIATAKSDLYSLGATLYQLATGTLPYSGSPAKVMAQIATGQRISAVKKRAEVGPDLSRVIDRLMASEPDQRPASAKDVAAELRQIAAASGLGDPVDELEAYFADPAAFVAAKKPDVVVALVAQGKQAITENKLPRAMALADRASALAPDDPEVAALITAVTEGGRSSSRRRVIAIGVLGVAVAGGAAVVGMKLLKSSPVVAREDAIVADTRTTDAIGDATAVIDAEILPVVDARSSRDARSARDATVPLIAPAIDAASAIDALVPDAPIEPKMGTLVVTSDAWCQFGLDHDPQVRLDGPPSSKSFVVQAGQHFLGCEQPKTDRTWSQTIDVRADQTVNVQITVLKPVTVRLEVAATLNGKPFAAGTSATFKRGQVTIEVAGHPTKYAQITDACVIRDQPAVDCYPR